MLDDYIFGRAELFQNLKKKYRRKIQSTEGKSTEGKKRVRRKIQLNRCSCCGNILVNKIRTFISLYLLKLVLWEADELNFLFKQRKNDKQNFERFTFGRICFDGTDIKKSLALIPGG